MGRWRGIILLALAPGVFGCGSDNAEEPKAAPLRSGVDLAALDPNIDAFHEAFGTQPGDGMWLPPEERVRIW